MSKLNDLIQELCPNGVEYKKLGEICDIKTGRGITKDDAVDNGPYPIISGGYERMGFYDKYNRDENTVTIARAGSAGFVQFIDCKFWVNDKCFTVIPKREYVCGVNSKFLYYALKNMEDDIVALKSTGSVPTVNTAKVSSIEVPLPPLEIQREIVKILDKFTQLQAELQAELELRSRQYEHYRDELLSFDNLNNLAGGVIRKVRLSELCDIRNGYTPSKSVYEYWNGETVVPWFRMEDIRANGHILSDSIQHVTKEAVKNGKLFPRNSIILATTATIGEHALITADSLANQRFTYLTIREPHKQLMDVKFFYYYMYIVDEWCKKNVNVSGFASVNMEGLKGLEVPLPPLKIQQEIVSVLDKFSALVSDITAGLPAEIKLRQQQYEYYRDKLLTFKPAN